MKKRFALLFVFAFMSLFSMLSLNLVNAFEVNGTVKDINGIVLNATNVSISSMYFAGGPPTTYSETSTLTNESGWFNLTVTDNSSRMYTIVIKHYNSSTGAVDYIGQSLPNFPLQEMSRGISTTFYLREAGTLNITAINGTNSRVNFNYMIKDTKLGYNIENNWNTQGGVAEANIQVPKDRNYSIMIFPVNNMPISYNWNNFSANSSYTLNPATSLISTYNLNTSTLHKMFNTSMTFMNMNGYVNSSYMNIIGWSELASVSFLVEPGNMIFMNRGSMPYNMSAWRGLTDVYTPENGFYNITLPAPAEPQTIIVLFVAKNGTTLYGSYKNVTVSYTAGEIQSNITLYGFLGDDSANLSNVQNSGPGNRDINISVLKLPLLFVNASSNLSVNLSTQAHVEVKVDYTEFGSIEFTFMEDTSSNANNVSVPLLNISGFKELNLFSQDYSPKRLSQKNALDLLANKNISLSRFNPGAIDNSVSAARVSISLLLSNSTCDVPNPPSNCYVVNSKNMDRSDAINGFNPLSAVIGGGKLSFRMGVGNVTVHYVNVDMLASGPPDVNFDANATTSASGSGGMAAAMRFGSQGPTIYDYVLVSIPYTEAVGVGNGLNDSLPINVSIPLLYDDSWNVIWNYTVNGSNTGVLAGNFTHYGTYKEAWGNLTIPKPAMNFSITQAAMLNETNFSYIDIANNLVWIRLPHFSGTGSEISGSDADSTFPTYSVSYPPNNTYLTGNFSFNISVVEQNLGTAFVQVINSTAAIVNTTMLCSGTAPDYTCTTRVNLTVATDQNIRYYLRLWINDTSNNLNASAVNVTEFILDSIKPVVNWTYPVNGTNQTSSVLSLYNISISEANYNYTNVSVYNVSSTGALTWVNSSVNSTAFNFNVSSLAVPADGHYAIYINAYDYAGNVNNVTTRNITVDSTAPWISMLSPAVNGTNYYPNQSVLINFVINEPITIVNNLTFHNSSINVSFTSGATMTLNFTSARGQVNFTLFANDTLGNYRVFNTYINVTNALAAGNTLLDNSGVSYNVGSDITNIILGYNSTVQNITLTNTTQKVSLDLNQLMVASKVANIVNTSFNLIANTSTANYTVYIPAGINITGEGSWDGKLYLPTFNHSYASFTAPGSGTTNLIIDSGSDVELNFSSPVKITLAQMIGKTAAWSRGSLTLTNITTYCDSETAPTNINGTAYSTVTRECYINSSNGVDLVIWTYHFTSFAAFTPAAAAAATTPADTSSPGGSTPTPSYWSMTYSITADQFATGYTKELLVKERIKFKIGNEDHHVGVVGISGNTATINVSSTPQQALFNVGEFKKFDVNADNIYDVLVSLVSINSTKANVNVKAISEQIPTTPIAPVNNTTKPITEQIGEQVDAVVDDVKSGVNKLSVAIWWIVIIIVIVIIVVVVLLLSRKKRKHGWEHLYKTR
ncbi:MAG: hypothetical protein WC796_01560 [Candidatus Pacearchaeota archaeon]|jgi:hypothetical protein